MLARDPLVVRIVDAFYAIGGLFYLVLVVLRVPLKSRQPKRERAYGFSTAVLFALFTAARFDRPDRGSWWWLGTAGAVLGVVAGLLWAEMAAKASPAPGEGGKTLRFRPWSLAVLVTADIALIAALKWTSGAVSWVLLAAGVLGLAVFVKVAWFEVPASPPTPDSPA